MATSNPPAGEPARPSKTTPPPNLQSAPPPKPHVTPVKAEASSTEIKDTPNSAANAAASAAPTPRPAEPPSPDDDVILIPSYSRWFSPDTVNECEQRLLPEFFDGRCPSRNPRIYRNLRNSIVKFYRQNPARKITFTDARKTLVGDVGSIRRIFDFLETWGLINYSGSSSKPLKWDDEKEASKSIGAASRSGGAAGGNAETSGSIRESVKRLCNGCKSVCTIACFASDKYDLTLCARCYVRGNYRVGVSSSDFRRVEINEETKAEWSEKETLHLLEGVMHHGDDWRKIAQHVGGRTEMECVSQFITLPFGEEFIGEEIEPNHVNDNGHAKFGSDSSSLLPCKRICSESGAESVSSSLPNKRVCLTPLADASNPIMAQKLTKLAFFKGWFSPDTINECEQRLLPEFFDGRCPSRNPRIYRNLRNSIVKFYRQNPARKITFTDARKTLVGDVGSIRRIFDFLETWGLINYSGSSSKPLKWDDEKEASKSTGAASQSGGAAGGNAETSGPIRESVKRLCNGCKSVCTIACFASDKYDLTLCARCYVRGNYRVGVSSSDFRRVEINEDTKAEWSEKETLHLLEGVMHHGDDWRKIAQHVGGRTEKECVSQFITLPFGEEFIGEEIDRKPNHVNDNGHAEFGSDSSSLLPCKRICSESGAESVSSSLPNKRVCLTPLADASNPIMAQAAFLSALAGVEVSEAAAQAAITALSEVDYGVPQVSKEGETSSNGDAGLNASEGALMEANLQLEKEELDLEKSVSEIVVSQMKIINEKIVEFEELDLLMEKEREEVEQLKNMLFVDKFMLSFYKNTSVKSTGGFSKEENVKPE